MNKFCGIPLLKKSIKILKIDENLIDENGYLKMLDYAGNQSLVSKMRELDEDIVVKSSELSAINIISGIIRSVVENYFEKLNIDAENSLENFLQNKFHQGNYQKCVEIISEKFYNSSTLSFDKIISIWLINTNSAFKNFRMLFDDNIDFEEYKNRIIFLEEFFETQPAFSDKEKNFIKFLVAPSKLENNSIFDQLKFIKDNWLEFIDADLSLILQTLDEIKEENKPTFFGPGPIPIHQFDYEDEYENFTDDKDWMSSLVLLAKSTFVWLDQLSRKYKIKIDKLDKIPEEELILQRSRGITGIWLIGIWERSYASLRIKQLNENNDALASAYSLDDYKVAENLGGEIALEVLKKKAMKYGIRIGCDMVPNHTGLDSKWMVDHPDWFIQSTQTPFNSYTFTGENISGKDEIEIKIEDHYFDKSDAAVVFQVKDKRDEQIRYVYHGNDGTSFPWNDTAQLDYLKKEVREAVIQKIIEIAQKFPIIRFDAAMTLAKKHIHRLWFPEPGEGGDIPSRARYSLTTSEFNKLLPTEFWRDLVDRVSIEAPDTLLLAEAFWMMEGYFVRTLGMHRVYNSAFMHMLMNEDNAKYRKSIFNVLEFNPQILKRFVNFISNPDEESAISQFGKDDKYFGVCLLMSTMPGLPMFAHGQIEGFTEKYGMEYHKPKWYEKEDKHLIERHEREIFPILKMRHLFSEVENFNLFDFVDVNNNLNENVFAYSNMQNNQTTLMVFNNKYEHTKGYIKYANSPKNIDDKVEWSKIELAEIFKLNNLPDHYLIYRDIISKKQFIRKSSEIVETGFFQDLNAYKYSLFTDFYEVEDDESKKYEQLFKFLKNNETNSIETSLKRIEYKKLINEFDYFIDIGTIRTFIYYDNFADIATFIPEFRNRITAFAEMFNKFSEIEIDKKVLINRLENDIRLFYNFRDESHSKLEVSQIIVWIFLHNLSYAYYPENEFDFEWTDKFFFNEKIEDLFDNKIINADSIMNISLIENSMKIYQIFIESTTFEEFSQNIFDQKSIQKFLLFNKYNNKIWFNKERFEMLFAFVSKICKIHLNNSKFQIYENFQNKIDAAMQKSEFLVEKLLKQLIKGDE